MSEDIDVDFRPQTYFEPRKLEEYLLSSIKGTVVRKLVRSHLEAGRHDLARELLITAPVSPGQRAVLESRNPMFMGGNYVPDTEDHEVEIASISIWSTTNDVTRVYAKREGEFIRYRVVDEYGGEFLEEPTETRTAQPMTLRELTEFFLSAWPMLSLMSETCYGNRAESLDFFEAESDFYPEFDDYCRELVKAAFPEDEEEEDDEDD